jgi:hypothetical protein
LNMVYTLRFFLNAVCFIILTCLVSVLFTLYIQSVLKKKKNNSGAKSLTVTWRSLKLHSHTYRYNHVLLDSLALFKSQSLITLFKFNLSNLSFISFFIISININNLKIKIYRTIILPVVLYGCETWSLTEAEGV